VTVSLSGNTLLIGGVFKRNVRSTDGY
jgi:hypothetical protein